MENPKFANQAAEVLLSITFTTYGVGVRVRDRSFFVQDQIGYCIPNGKTKNIYFQAINGFICMNT
jgi:hypothetical protein